MSLCDESSDGAGRAVLAQSVLPIAECNIGNVVWSSHFVRVGGVKPRR